MTSVLIFQKCNVFYGSNGWKTNPGSYIYFSKGRGLRKDKIFNFIKNNEDFSNDANFIDENVEYELNVFRNKNNKFQKIKLMVKFLLK